MNGRKLWLLAGVVALLVAAGGAGWLVNHFWHGDPASGGRQPPVNETSDDPPGVVCTGYVDLEHGVRSLAPLRPGRVAEVLARENTHVESGAPILRLEDQDAKFQLAEAEAAVAAAEAQLAEARQAGARHRARLAQQQAALDAAGYRLSAARVVLRRKEQQKSDLISPEDVQTTRDEVRALEAQERAEREKLAEVRTLDPALVVRKAQAELDLARVRRDQARHQLDECILKAPSAGTVQRIAVGAGDVLAANPAQPVVRFRPDEPPLVRAEVNQEFADRVRVGQPALVRDDAHAGPGWRGKVVRVAGWFEQRRPSTLDPSAYTDVRTVECLVAIDPGQPPLRLGQRMRVLIGRVPQTDSE